MTKILRTFSLIIILSSSFLFLYFLPPLVFAADCSDVSPSGNLTVTTGCTFSGDVNGVDSGVGNTNTANLAVTTGGTLTIGATQTIAMGSLSVGGGSIVIIDGGSMKFGAPLWMEDGDGDSFAANSTQYAQATPPPNGQRRNTIVSLSTIDNNDSESCPENFNPDDICTKCQSGALANQSDGEDLFAECQSLYKCNGAGTCTLHRKRVFITSTYYRGDMGGGLGGLPQADNNCHSQANAAGLGSTWKAWLSNSTTSVASRLTHSMFPYSLVDDTTKIADNWTDLTDESLQASINKNEFGTILTGSNPVWTNTKSDGSIFTTDTNDNCTNWVTRSASRIGRYGLNNLYTSSSWTDAGNAGCNQSNRLYCFEQ